MSTVETRKFEPATGTAVNLGASGDAVTLPAGVTLQTNTIKDAGGNTIFTSDGAGTLSSVNSGLQGNMVFISSVTASASSSIEFTSGIDSTYDEYMFTLTNINLSVNSEDFNLNFSLAGSFSSLNMYTTMFVQRHDEDGSDGSLFYQPNADLTNSTSQKFADSSQLSNAADANLSGILHLFSPSSTTYVKQFYFRTIANGNVPGATAAMVGGYVNDTGAVTQVQFAPSSGTFDGTIAMYGIK
jgi:hypothetical protein